MSSGHHDYTGKAVAPPPPEPSPNPKPVMPIGTPHPWACRYPVEMAWTQSAQEKWDAICESSNWTVSARKWLYGLTIAVLTIAVTISVAAGTSCRNAGAQEQQLERAGQDIDGLRIIVGDQAKRMQEIDARQTERYERLLEITSRIDARLVAEQEQRQQQAKHP